MNADKPLLSVFLYLSVIILLCMLDLLFNTKIWPSQGLQAVQYNIYIHKNGCVCVRVCVFEHNSGTPGAISTKLGTRIAICICKNLMYDIYIYLFIYLLSINFPREFG
jgi:hypothetical protein